MVVPQPCSEANDLVWSAKPPLERQSAGARWLRQTRGVGPRRAAGKLEEEIPTVREVSPGHSGTWSAPPTSMGHDSRRSNRR